MAVGPNRDILDALDVGDVEALDPVTHAAIAPHVPLGHVMRMGTHGDGSCFFHSLAALVNYKNYLAQPFADRQALGHEFRRTFVTRLTTKDFNHLQSLFPNNMRRTRQELCDGLARPEEWADESMIKFVSHILKVNLLFLSGTTGHFQCTLAGNPAEHATGVVVWINNCHFEPLLWVYLVCKNHVHLKGTLTPKSPNDIAHIAHIIQMFWQQCRVALPSFQHPNFRAAIDAHEHNDEKPHPLSSPSGDATHNLRDSVKYHGQ